jgi:hypothetical protein
MIVFIQKLDWKFHKSMSILKLSNESYISLSFRITCESKEIKQGSASAAVGKRLGFNVTVLRR